VTKLTCHRRKTRLTLPNSSCVVIKRLVEHFSVLTTDQCETDRFGCALVLIVLATAEMTYLLFVEWDSKLRSLTTVKLVGVNECVALKVGDRLLRCLGGHCTEFLLLWYLKPQPKALFSQ